MRKSTTVVNVIKIMLFLAFLIVPVIFINRKDNQVSEIDNTILMNADQVGKVNSLSDDTEVYLSQHIGFRDRMLTEYIDVNDKAFNMLIHPQYEYGKEGYVFFKMPVEKQDAGYLKAFARFTKRMQKYCNKRDIYFLYCINPDKTEIYSEYLPAGVNLTYFRQRYLRVMLDKYGVNYMDNVPVLEEAAKSQQVFNIKYDAGHWNDTGAYVGMSNILSELAKYDPSIPQNKREDYTAVESVNEYLPLSYFEINEPTVTLTRNKPEAIDISLQDTDVRINPMYNDFSHYVNPKHKKLPRILVFRGSYFLGREKFMTESFSESIFVHSYENVFNLEYYVERYKPDIVLFESVEYATINTYFPKEKLKTVKFVKS